MNNLLPCITLYQPWATWIINGWKTIETRTHDKFRSLEGKTIGIHAGKHYDKNAYDVAMPYLDSNAKAILKSFPIDYSFGKLLGTAYVVNFGLLYESDSKGALIECKTRRYGLFLTDIKILVPEIPLSGKQGIWYVQYE